MLKVLDVSARALHIASACGTPFIGVAGIILQDIVKVCNDTKLHKQKSLHLASKCRQIHNALNDRASRSDLEGSEFRQIADELIAILQKVQNRTKKWSTYSLVMTFLHSGEIKNSLEYCHTELDAALNLFHIKFVSPTHFNLLGASLTSDSSHIINHNIQRDTLAEVTEIHGLLLELLRNQSERQQLVTLQSQGKHVAEKVMAAGQEQLQLLREYGDGMTSGLEGASVVLPRVTDSQKYLQCQRDLISLHRETGIPPTIKKLDREVTRTSELTVAGGMYSDIWMGVWLGEEKVALKAIRNTRVSDPTTKKRFENEINLWTKLKHSNILAFYGIVTDIGQHIHMVSPWQENGNVLEYVKAHNDANRICLISGAAQGLDYLHANNIVHGNMKCANILVSSKGEAYICDFGMSKIIEDVTEINASLTLTEGGSARWLAPELIEGKSPTKEADVYSFAMTILELITEKHPYVDCKRDAQVIRNIVVLRRLPEFPINEAANIWLSHDLWQLMRRSWQWEPSARPSMSEVSLSIGEIDRRYAVLTDRLC